MAFATVHSKATGGLIQAALRGALTKTQARRLANENPEVIAFALLATSKRIAELQEPSPGQPPSPSTSSGMVPIYTKPNTPKRRKKPGAKQGHSGRRREKPDRIDDHQTHRLKRCPCCRGPKEKARQLCENSLTQYPVLVEARCTLGFLKIGAGDYRGAGNEFEFALAQQPALAEALLGRAAVLARTGSGAEAERILQSLLERHSIAVRRRYELGRIYHARGELDKASAHFLQALGIVFPEENR